MELQAQDLLLQLEEEHKYIYTNPLTPLQSYRMTFIDFSPEPTPLEITLKIIDNIIDGKE